MSRSLRPVDVYPITTRTLEVLRVADVTPGMRRVTLGGPELAAHTAENGFPVAAFRSKGFDDEGKLILKHPDVEVAVAPTQADGVLNWPRNEHLLFRTYTVRRWDPAAGEVDLDFVRHGIGPATSWADAVRPGDRVQWAGPKSSAPHPVDVDWTLVAGDETALPAIGRWLEEWPEGARGQVFIEVAEESHRQLDLPVPEGVELTWLVRHGAEPGTTTLLFDAISAADWWPGRVFAWVAGESLTLVPIRRWLRNERELSKEQVEVCGYWRRQEVAVDEAGEIDLGATEDDGQRFHELGELMPGFALRVAASIGIAQAFGAESRTVAELASVTGADPVGLSKLLRYLSALGVTEAVEAGGDAAAESAAAPGSAPDAGSYRLTPLGRELEDEDTSDELDLGGHDAQEELTGLLSLLSAVRSGAGDAERWIGSSWAERVEQDPELLAARIEHEAEDAEYTAAAVAAAPLVTEALGIPRDTGAAAETTAETTAESTTGPATGPATTTVAVVGEASAAYALALVEAQSSASAVVLAAPSELAALQGRFGEHERIEYRPGSLLNRLPEPVDAVLIAGHLGKLPDSDASHLLRQAAESVRPGGRVIVFADVLDETLADEHDYEHDLLDFALTGGGARSHEEFVRLCTAAGLGTPERATVAWGSTLYAIDSVG